MKLRITLILWLLFETLPVYAGPADHLFTLDFERGEYELDVAYGAASGNPAMAQKATSIGLGYGVTDRWYSEGSMKQKTAAGRVSDYAEWENRLLLTEPKRFPVDAGILFELEAPFDRADPWEMKFGPMLQSRYGNWQTNANLIFEHAMRGRDEHGVPHVMNLSYQWQLRYGGGSGLDAGVQGFGELGQWNCWGRPASQSHQLGPALFGSVHLAGDESFKYQLVWLFGASPAAPDRNLRLKLEFEL